jgi:cyclic pyranopterin phosphate synthase
MLTDNFNRKFSYLRLSITDLCNFRCDYCLPNGYQAGEQAKRAMSLQEIDTLVRAFAASGTRKIRITGGEPTLRSDLLEIIQLCRATPGIEQVVMTTNGYKLSHWLPELKEAGLDRINISLDSLDPSVFRMITGHDRLRDILAAVDQAVAMDMPVKLNAVLMRHYNGKDLKRFTDYLRDTPITARFIELMETGDTRDFFRQQHQSADSLEYWLQKQGWQPRDRHRDAGPAREYQHPAYRGRVGLIRPYRQGFCDDCNRLRVSAFGDLQLCLFSEGGIPLRHYLRTHSARELVPVLHRMVRGKRESHGLHQHDTGATAHLAMIGG